MMPLEFKEREERLSLCGILDSKEDLSILGSWIICLAWQQSSKKLLAAKQNKGEIG